MAMERNLNNDNDVLAECYPLIQRLAAGQFCSGEALGQHLGVSRAAIWKKIQKLEQLGLVCQSVRGKGYCIPGGIDLLDSQTLELLVNENLGPGAVQVDLRLQVGSTNSIVLEQAEVSPSAYVCLAEQQKSGRGRLGRSWYSPFARNIYLSMLWHFPAGAGALDGLSLVVGLAVARTLVRCGLADVALKWPNDVLVQNKKIAGILLEMRGDATGACSVVIGVGLNVAMPADGAQQISQPWTDLASHIRTIKRNEVAAYLICEIYLALASFQRGGFLPFKQEWENLDAFRQQAVSVHLGDQVVNGLAVGISDRGEFCLKVDDAVRVFSGGEVTVRREA